MIVWTLVGAVALGWVFLIIAEAVRVIWLPIAFAAGIVFLLDPLVRMFERLRMPRLVGAILALLIMVAVIVDDVLPPPVLVMRASAPRMFER